MENQNPFADFLSRLDQVVQRFLAEGVTDGRDPQDDEEIRTVITDLWSRIRKQRIRIVTGLTRTRRGGPPEQVAFDTLDGLVDWVENHPHPLLDDLEDFRDWVSIRQYLTPTDPLRLRYTEYTAGEIRFTVESPGLPVEARFVPANRFQSRRQLCMERPASRGPWRRDSPPDISRCKPSARRQPMTITAAEMQAMVRILEEWHRICVVHGVAADLDAAHRLAARHLQLHRERRSLGLVSDKPSFPDSLVNDLIRYGESAVTTRELTEQTDQFISCFHNLAFWMWYSNNSLFTEIELNGVLGWACSCQDRG